MLDSAWKRKSYSDIRNLVPGAVPEPPAQNPIDQAHELSRGLRGKTPWRSCTKYLTHSEKLFEDSGPGYYVKLCSVVQSSVQLRKMGAIVIYMNLREFHRTS